ncbi:pentatricopeptide repeat-containing protein [Tanacetum coccineum]
MESTTSWPLNSSKITHHPMDELFEKCGMAQMIKVSGGGERLPLGGLVAGFYDTYFKSWPRLTPVRRSPDTSLDRITTASLFALRRSYRSREQYSLHGFCIDKISDKIDITFEETDFQDLNHLNFFNNDCLETPIDDEIVESELVSDGSFSHHLGSNVDGRGWDAERVCSEMQDRNVVSWTSMLMGYLLRGLYDESLKLHLQMQVDGVKPNPFTFATILGALADSGVVVKGMHWRW